MSATGGRALVSPLAHYIEGLLSTKRAMGYSYEFEEYELRRFDELCRLRGLAYATIDRELAMAWAEPRPSESEGYRCQRVSFVRQLALYMVGQGIDCYVPRGFSTGRRRVPYVPTRAEVEDLIAAAEAWAPRNPSLAWMAREYPMAFRLMWCCGLRLGEVAHMRREDAELDAGVLTVRHSKGDKDRLVYVADDLAGACRSYWRAMVEALGLEPEWLFPGKFGRGHVCKTTFDAKFRQFWEETPAAARTDRRPTPHCLRHAFVVERINSWAREGADVDAMMPYLSKYLGHAGPRETFYYYHQAMDAISIVRELDSVCSRVVPGVVDDV